MVACLQIWYLFYKFGVRTGSRESWAKTEYRTANIAPRASLVEPVFKYIDQIMTSKFPINLPDGRMVTNKCLIEWFYLKDKTNNNPPFKQFFANNSYIEHRTIGATASDSLEGKPFGIITYDEGGRSDHLEAEVNGTLLARLFDWQGPLHIVSTPDQNSSSILFHYKLYQDGLKGLNRTYTQEGSLYENTFFSKEQINEQYELYKNNPLRGQVLEGKFVFGGANIFNTDDINAACDDELNNGEGLKPDHQYVIGIDTALGTDETVYTVLDITDEIARLVWLRGEKGNSKSPQMHIQDFVELFNAYTDIDMDGNTKDNVKVILETWNGESARFYQDLPANIQAVTKCYGSWQPMKANLTQNKNLPPKPNSNVKKADILISLRKRLSARTIKIPNEPKLTQQLSIYREDDSNIPTDRVMSLALACWMTEEKAKLFIPKQAWISIEW